MPSDSLYVLFSDQARWIHLSDMFNTLEKNCKVIIRLIPVHSITKGMSQRQEKLSMTVPAPRNARNYSYGDHLKYEKTAPAASFINELSQSGHRSESLKVYYIVMRHLQGSCLLHQNRSQLGFLIHMKKLLQVSFIFVCLWTFHLIELSRSCQTRSPNEHLQHHLSNTRSLKLQKFVLDRNIQSISVEINNIT